MVQIYSDGSILNDDSFTFVDMHHHSTISDGDLSPSLLLRLFKKNGFGLCLADHNQIRGSVFLCGQKNFFSIPSIEITSVEYKDVLAYFYSVSDLVSFWEKEIKKSIRNNAVFNFNRTRIPFHDLLDKIKDYNGICALAHPFALRPKKSFHLLEDKSVLKRIDILESHNFVNDRNGYTFDFVKKFDKPMIAGSDSHYVSRFNSLTGASANSVDCFLDEVLKKKNVVFYKKLNPVYRFFEKFIVFKNNLHLMTP